MDHVFPKLSPKDQRVFAFTLSAFFCVWAGMTYWRHPDHVFMIKLFLGLSPVALLFAIFYPKGTLPVFYLLTGFGFVMTRVLMFIALIVVVTPLRLLLLASGKDPMRRKIDKNLTSYWQDADYPNQEMKDYTNPH